MNLGMHQFYAIVLVGEKSKKSIPLRADICLKMLFVMIFAMLFAVRYGKQHTE